MLTEQSQLFKPRRTTISSANFPLFLRSIPPYDSASPLSPRSDGLAVLGNPSSANKAMGSPCAANQSFHSRNSRLTLLFPRAHFLQTFC
jgi:hypothetical protein